MLICIVSDSHDRADALASAVAAAKADGAEAVIHCGDLIGVNTLRPAAKYGLPMHVIQGNNLGDAMAMHAITREPCSVVRYHGADARLDLGGRKIFVVHYPDYGRAFASTGDWDLVCCGHDHKAKVERVPNTKGGETPLANPGTVAGLSSPPTWILGDLSTMRFDIRTL